MAHHNWGDREFDWAGLDSAIRMITHICHKWGRINMNSKEKWGCMRDGLMGNGLWDGTLERLIYPGHYFIRLPHWFYWHVDYPVIRWISYFTGAQYLFSFYQAEVYNFAIQMACRKYPHLVDEIVSDLDGYHMVLPGFFGWIDGKEIHDKHWKSIDDEEDRWNL